MAYRLDIHPDAEAEFDEALQWYQAQREGLELEFFREYLGLEKQIAENPYLFPQILENVRRAVFPRFPYSVFYSIEGECIYIYAVFHQKRAPESWAERL